MNYPFRSIKIKLKRNNKWAMDKILLKSQKIGLQFETILKEIAFLRSNARLVCCAIINASL
jgi:hypothetical protein